MKTVNFASCNIDYVYSLDHIVRPGETEGSEKLELFPGGKGLNQTVALARAGMEVYPAAIIGEATQALRSTPIAGVIPSPSRRVIKLSRRSI